MFASPFYLDSYKQQKENYRRLLRQRENERRRGAYYDVSQKELEEEEEEARYDDHDCHPHYVYVRGHDGRIYRMLENDFSRTERMRQKENERFQRAYDNASQQKPDEEEEGDECLDKRDSQPRYVYVRGNDGHIYKVLQDDVSGSENQRLKDRKSLKNKKSSTPFGRETTKAKKLDEKSEKHGSKHLKLERQRLKDRTSRKDKKISASFGPDETKAKKIDEESEQEKLRNSTSWQRRMKNSKIQNLRSDFEAPQNINREAYKSSIMVEDASDSELEDDRNRSVWCNRRPSPGEWMEPVQQKISNEQ